MACIYYTASSLDGFVVDEAGSLEWLLSRDVDEDGAFGYAAFAKSVGALVMGSATYEWIVENEPGDWMYAQPTWVLTSRPGIVVDGHPVLSYAGGATEIYPTVAEAEAAGGRDVWLMGGGVVAAQFAEAGLIDEMVVSYAPCTLGRGAQVLPARTEWSLAEVGRNADFVCARWVKAS